MEFGAFEKPEELGCLSGAGGGRAGPKNTH